MSNSSSHVHIGSVYIFYLLMISFIASPGVLVPTYYSSSIELRSTLHFLKIVAKYLENISVYSILPITGAHFNLQSLSLYFHCEVLRLKAGRIIDMAQTVADWMECQKYSDPSFENLDYPSSQYRQPVSMKRSRSQFQINYCG